MAVTLKQLLERGEDLKAIARYKEGSPGGSQGNLVFSVGPSVRRPAENVVRPVGFPVYRRVHFLSQLSETLALPRMVVCPKFHDRENYCPLCRYGWELWRGADGDEEQESVARRVLSRDRFHLVVIPRYPQGESEEARGKLEARWLAFGNMAYEGYELAWKKYGNPGDVNEGYDMNYLAWYKGSGRTRFRNYRFEPVMTGSGKRMQLKVTPLTPEEKRLEFPDIAEFFKEMDREMIEKVNEVLFSSSSRSRSEREEVLEHEREIGDEASEVGTEYACFGDEETFDIEDEVCQECKYFDECKKEVQGG